MVWPTKKIRQNRTSNWSSSVKGANCAWGTRERQTGATQAFLPVTALRRTSSSSSNWSPASSPSSSLPSSPSSTVLLSSSPWSSSYRFGKFAGFASTKSPVQLYRSSNNWERDLRHLFSELRLICVFFGKIIFRCFGKVFCMFDVWGWDQWVGVKHSVDSPCLNKVAFLH